MMKEAEIVEKREVVGRQQAEELIQEGWIVLSSHVVGERQVGQLDPPLKYVLGKPREYNEQGEDVTESPRNREE
jgi:16S rRNA U516 pseudouridylate synthase RsuA-like enzyme